LSDRTLRPDPHLKIQDNGEILIGGSPTAVMRLSAKGAAIARSWFRGEPIAQTKRANELAERLVGAGMAHPVPPDTGPDFTVVIPVRNDPEGLAVTQACLAELPDHQVLVAPDSAPTAMGPAAARNSGAKRCETEVLIFIDAGVRIDGQTLQLLANHLGTPGTIAVAPRVTSEPGSGAIAAYELKHSPLDLGRSPGEVAPGHRISYVPSTVLAIRTDAFEAAGGFDPDLRYGEDVDLIWRLARTGTVRYDPSLTATHPPRGDLASFARQRYNYGTSASALGALHGSAVAPVVLSPWSLVTLGLALAPLPKMLLVWLGATIIGLSRKLPGSTAVANATQMSIVGHLNAARSIASASTRAWWPVSLVAIATPLRSRVALLALWSWLGNRSFLGLVDDVAYGTGVWRGTLRTRTVRSVLPRFSNQS
jgi:mycofactocin system glycosyltransferase